MFNIERWQEIFEAIANNKLRTFLTGISVASGIFILVILLGAGQGLQNGIQKQFERDATGLIEIWSNVTTKEYKGMNPGRFVQLHNSDYELANQKFDKEIVVKGLSYSYWNAAYAYKKETGNYQFRGVNPGMQAVENMTMTSGRFINANDVDNFEKIAIIGEKLKQDLFKEENPIGKQLTINGIPFKVVGVFTDPGGEREEARAYLPITTAQNVFGLGTNINNMFYTLKKHDNYDEALAESEKFSSELGSMLRSKNFVAPDDEGAIGIH
ncbi:MAG TPA: ABC transporter permease, partial [Flavobacterium sp.]|nr:ABC transporter permease [Flavobacterium sp.]